MFLEEYAARIAPLDNYHKPDALMFYALGMCGEAAELFRACTHGNSDAVIAECGDVCWYAMRLFSRIKTLAGIDERALERESTLYPSPYDYGDLVEAVIYAAGDVAEAVKKTYRDCDGRLSGEGVSRMLAGVKSILSAVNRMGGCHLAPLYTILDRNIEKLESRRRRGCLAGGGTILNGDDR